MDRKNCWEEMKCGREPGGEMADELGVCPAAMPGEFDGTNHGVYGGRFCWAVAGTLCGGKVQGSYAKKLKTCLDCPFMKHAGLEEGSTFRLSPADAPKEY